MINFHFFNIILELEQLYSQFRFQRFRHLNVEKKSRQFNLLSIKRIVSVSFRFILKQSPIKSIRIEFQVQRKFIYNSLSQVRIANIVNSKRNGVTISLSYILQPTLKSKTTVPNNDPIEKRTKCFTNILDLLLRCYMQLKTLCSELFFLRLHKFNKSYFSGIEFFQQKRIGFQGIIVTHIIESKYRAQFNSYPKRLIIFQSYIYELEYKSATILCATTIFIVSSIRIGTYELIYQVPIRSMKLQTIKTCSF